MTPPASAKVKAIARKTAGAITIGISVEGDSGASQRQEG
jgi:hypothetical protein